MSDEVLIVAGGANFPDKVPWEGGEKICYDKIFLLAAGIKCPLSTQQGFQKYLF